MRHRIICITAAQRSGTTALQRALASSGEVENCGEIFQDDPASRAGIADMSFSAFARLYDIRLTEVMKSTGALDTATRYTQWLASKAAPKRPLIDVKLNAWLALAPAWKYPQEEPLFLRHLKRERTAFICIWREDLAEQILSMFISQKLGIWHNIDAEKVAGRRFDAPITRLKRTAGLLCRSELDMHEYLRSYPDKIIVRYEDMFADGGLSENFASALEALTGVKSPRGRSAIRPNSVSKRDIIANYEEAAAAIRKIAIRYRTRELDEHTFAAR
ncbi:MAG TPA: hypothetical protein VHX61_02515 [Rhizomicrobium sp.]|jgi:hypothetical protein|nr:hypothetical protein [Rhizomicrobium sp.]